MDIEWDFQAEEICPLRERERNAKTGSTFGVPFAFP
jgi:hypothetical protein